MVKRLVQLQFCLDEDELCFISLKSKKHSLFGGMQMSSYHSPEGGFYNLDKTLDSEFYCLKCFDLKSFQEPNTIL